MVETTNQSVSRVLRIAACFGMRAPAECAEKTTGGV
jgi:hypothetical protein